MSHTDDILGINHLIIEKTKKHKHIDIWAKPANRPRCKHCDSEHVVIKASHRKLLSLMRYHQWHLSPAQHRTLMTYLAKFPVLEALYLTKQRLIRFMLLRTVKAKRMQTLLPDFLGLLTQIKHSPLNGLAKTISSWMEPILAMWRYSKNNGMTEGFHTKMEMLSRRAYGFRNFQNYRLRVMTHCGWDGIINRVR